MSDTRIFGEVTRSVTATYPVPFLVACLLAFGLGCFGIGLAVKSSLVWLIDGTGAAAALVALIIAAYAVLHRTELLRSERHTLNQRAIDILGNANLTVADRQKLMSSAKLLIGDEPDPPK